MRRPTRSVLSLVVPLMLLATATGCWRERQAVPAPPTWPSGAAPTWQWQLRGEPDAGVDADVFVLDPFAVSFDLSQRLRDRHRRLVCSVSAGIYEPDRPDESRFPDPTRGAAAGPAGRWLDIRQWDALRPVIADRFRLCRGKGFDAVVPAGVDGYLHPSGFPLTFDDQLLFNRRLAGLARSLGLSPGLRNDVAQVAALAPDFDFALNEECVRFRQCDRLLPFVDAGKLVFHVEYEGAVSDFCTTSRGYGFSSIRKERTLGAWRTPCPH